ncbi:MAG: beta-N-acetylhexosaminidase [Acidobacteriia bacterium]|nr:beta-N-acetylhexosaminidase [Terriglobia bacterium]
MRRSSAILLLLCALAPPVAAQELKLIPEPREVQRKSGRFEVGAATRIVVGAKHAGEDRVAAETIAAEIENATGRKLRITAGALPSGAGLIYLARTDEPGVARRLQAANLQIPDDFDEEGYVLDATPSSILIVARTGSGVFYGAQTLRQMLLPAAGDPKKLSVPAVAIRDWPAMRWRGVHDDISRGPIPTLEYMKKEVRTLAEYKMNLFSLYMEHVFDYASQPLVAPHEAAITPEQVKELVAYARRYHVTVMPEQEPFGHLHHVLKYELYQDIAETPHGHVITPTNPRSFEFVRSMFAELAQAFPSPLFHICADETFELGQGRTQELAQKEGLGKVYLDDIIQLYEIMKPYHKRLLFWADVAEKYPQLLGALPKDMIANAWGYDARPDFTSKIKPFRDTGLDVFVSPGSNSWNRVWPDLDVAFVNVRNFVRDGQKLGAMGMLNTTWDDDGEAFFGSTWAALVLGAAASWQPGEVDIQRVLANYDWAFYRNHQDNTFRDVILNLNTTNALLKQAGAGAASNDMFWIDPFTPEGARLVGRTLPVMHDLRIAAENALVALYKNAPKARLHADTLDYMVVAAMRLDLLGMKVQFADEINRCYRDAQQAHQEAAQNPAARGRINRDIAQITGTNGRLQDLRDATTRAEKFYSDLWLKESRPYWLANVQVRYDHLADLYTAKIQAVKAAKANAQDTGVMTPAEELGFYNPVPPPPPQPKPGTPAPPTSSPTITPPAQPPAQMPSAQPPASGSASAR